ncbi:MAG: glycosyltransferase [Burkholderiales bacterium]|nr:glycosyltransferase [Phycisphaerae bacterium]
MIDLSIVLPTCNRAPLLARAIETVAATARCKWELIVVDGASQDDTWPTLLRYQQQYGDRLQVIREEKRRGFVKAMNLGFLNARGRNMMWLNDDARPLPGALDNALSQIDRAPADVAFLAMFHRWHSIKNVAYQATINNAVYSLCHIRGTLYANFPIGRRAMFDQLGYFDEQFVFCGADPDLSLKAWLAGYRVEPAWGVCIDHDEYHDDRRDEDSPQLQADNARLFAKWALPPRNALSNDFDPGRPCTLRGIAAPSAVAA